MPGTDEDKPLSLDLFSVPSDGPLDPRPIVERLVDTVQQFLHLKIGEAVIMVLYRHFDDAKHGKSILGTMELAEGNGSKLARARFQWMMARMTGGTVPDFILTLDHKFWLEASDHQREALVFHELCHGGQKMDRDGEPMFTDDGNPVWDIRGHDIEEFGDVVERYGAWLADVQVFADALKRGGVVK